jgi:hypothetical protein
MEVMPANGFGPKSLWFKAAALMFYCSYHQMWDPLLLQGQCWYSQDEIAIVFLRLRASVSIIDKLQDRITLSTPKERDEFFKMVDLVCGASVE